MHAVVSRTQEAWRRYATTGCIAEGELRPHAYRAWMRSHASGADPRRQRLERLERGELERVLERKRPILQAASPYLRLLSRAASRERHAIYIADADGVLIDSVGNDLGPAGAEALPAVGSLFAEKHAGANGLGTALAEGEYVELLAQEHFLESLQRMTTQGMPVRGPDGRPVAALATGVLAPTRSRRLRALLTCAVRALEAELLAHRLEEDAAEVATAAIGNRAPVARLEEDLARAGRTLRLQLDAAALVSSDGRDAQAADLLRFAEASIDRLTERAQLWRALATGDRGLAEPIRAAELVRSLIRLLEDEARAAGVGIATGRMDEPLVLSSPQKVARLTLECFLRALEVCEPGATIRVELRRMNAEALALVFKAIPPTLSRRAPFTIGDTLPLAARKAGASVIEEGAAARALLALAGG